MSMTRIPDWVTKKNIVYNSYGEIPQEVFDEVNSSLDRILSQKPLVSVVIAAFNEEVNILKCVSSLSEMKTAIPFEIIVVNNNSSDKTEDTLNRLHVRHLFQPIQGCGPARQFAQENAFGKYILLADADCIYPSCWIDEMMKVLLKDNTACVYGRYSFIPEPDFPRWKLFMLERMKDVVAELRHFRRPYLNAYGISMGYVKEYGLRAGYIMVNVRGDDGRLAFDMMKYGKIRQVKSDDARPWTSPRTLQRDGTLTTALKNRILREFKRFFKMFSAEKPHDTKTSVND